MLLRTVFFWAFVLYVQPIFAQSSSDVPKAILVKEEYIFENPPFPSCHASTIVETSPGKLMAAWFGGTDEGEKDVGIWLSTSNKGQWSKPTLMAEGIIDKDTRWPCWNPVLFKSKAGKLFLFYKVGPSPREWWGMLRTSTNDGRTWTKPERLPDGILGPIKNKPVQLADGSILSPSSTETSESWKGHVERSPDGGKTWTLIPVDPQTKLDVIQGSILTYPDQRLQMLCRSKQNRIAEVWSNDGGKTWGELSNRNPQPQLRHRRRDAQKRLANIDLQSHNPGRQMEQRPPEIGGGHVERWQNLDGCVHAGRSAQRRVQLPGRDTSRRWQGAHHLHLATYQCAARGAGFEQIKNKLF